MPIIGHSSGELYARLEELVEGALRRDGEGAVLEIGTAQGGSAAALMRGIAASKVSARLVTCDPWGGKPYPMSGSVYGDSLAWDALEGLGALAAQLKVHWQHERRAGLTFLEHVARHGFWQDGRQHQFRWALAFIDGEHVWETVGKELDLVYEALQPSGVIVCDNVNHAQCFGLSMKEALDQWAEAHGMAVRYWMPPDGSEVGELTRKEGQSHSKV